MIVIDIKTGQPHKVWKYLLSGDGQESVWCHDWYGHHVIGDDCVFAKSVEYSSNQNNKPFVIPVVSNSSCPRCDSSKDIRRKPVTYDCMECGYTWQDDC